MKQKTSIRKVVRERASTASISTSAHMHAIADVPQKFHSIEFGDRACMVAFDPYDDLGGHAAHLQRGIGGILRAVQSLLEHDPKEIPGAPKGAIDALIAGAFLSDLIDAMHEELAVANDEPCRCNILGQTSTQGDRS